MRIKMWKMCEQHMKKYYKRKEKENIDDVFLEIFYIKIKAYFHHFIYKSIYNFLRKFVKL